MIMKTFLFSPLASLRAGVLSLLLVSAGSLPAIDINGNGLSDIWEANYAGSLSALTDADADGVNSLWEYYLGRNPVVADGGFPWSQSWTSSTLSISLTAPASLEYYFESSPGLEFWDPASGVLLGQGTAQVTVLPRTSDQRRFFRIASRGYLNPDGDEFDAKEETIVGTPTTSADQDGDGLFDSYEWITNGSPSVPTSAPAALPASLQLEVYIPAGVPVTP
jgi:hypothetical protein